MSSVSNRIELVSAFFRAFSCLTYTLTAESWVELSYIFVSKNGYIINVALN
jgi:hypothetical protein